MKKLIPTFILKWLVRKNFANREAGGRPNKWYWADLELLCRGWLCHSPTPYLYKFYRDE